MDCCCNSIVVADEACAGRAAWSAAAAAWQLRSLGKNTDRSSGRSREWLAADVADTGTNSTAVRCHNIQEYAASAVSEESAEAFAERIQQRYIFI